MVSARLVASAVVLLAAFWDAVKSLVGRARGALTARGTRRKYVRVGSVAASMPPHGPAIGEDTAPENASVALLKACLLLCL
ncbi:hypothetical protein XarjCFBP7653_15035 [Xanthomonas arboricola]|nr:hypothetical protein XarjCFBP7653_15035 [Xanthomonas arboricola]